MWAVLQACGDEGEGGGDNAGAVSVWGVRGRGYEGGRVAMPYKSKKQRAYLHIHHPGIAARWDKKYGGKVLVRRKRRVKRKK